MTEAERRVILVGVGGFGREWRAALERSACVVVGAVDPDPAALADAAALYALSPDRALDDPDATDWAGWPADLVIDASPARFHRANATAAVAGALDVVVAKPLADSLADGCAATSAAEHAGRLLAVAQQQRFQPAFLELRRLVQERELGVPGIVHVDLNLAGASRSAGRSWRLQKPYPLLLGGSVHDFDLMRWVLGEDAVAAIADSFNPPWSPFAHDAAFTATVEFESGLRVDYRASFAQRHSPRIAFDSGWSLELEHGYVEVRDGSLLVDGRPRDLQPGPRSEDLPALNGEVLLRVLGELEGGELSGLDARDNLRSLAIPHACRASIEEGRRVAVGQVLAEAGVAGAVAA